MTMLWLSSERLYWSHVSFFLWLIILLGGHAWHARINKYTHTHTASFMGGREGQIPLTFHCMTTCSNLGKRWHICLSISVKSSFPSLLVSGLLDLSGSTPRFEQNMSKAYLLPILALDIYWRWTLRYNDELIESWSTAGIEVVKSGSLWITMTIPLFVLVSLLATPFSDTFTLRISVCTSLVQ